MNFKVSSIKINLNLSIINKHLILKIYFVVWRNRRVTGRAKRIVPKAPPLPYSRPAPSLARLPTNAPPSSIDDHNQSVFY